MAQLGTSFDKANTIVSTKGKKIKDDIMKRLQRSQTEEGTTKNRRYYYHPPGNVQSKVMMASIIETNFISKQKTVSLILHDITDELVKEEKKAEKKYNNMILFSLSHELKTPLNVFKGFLRNLRRSGVTEDLSELLRNAKGAWNYLNNKVNDILDYAQILAEEFSLHVTTFSLRRFVKSLKKVAYYLLAEKRSQIELDFTVDENIEDEFRGDRERLGQVLFNFLSNAERYTTAGKISLRISANSGINSIKFEVSDTGAGMTKETTEALFKLKSPKRTSSPGEQLNIRATRLSGLGLTVCKMICGKMGSDITVTSITGKGSTFAFCVYGEKAKRRYTSAIDEVPDEDTKINTIMLNHSSKAIGQRLNTKTLSLRSLDNGIKVVVVDDNWFNRDVVIAMVRKFSFSVYEADNGKKALEVVTRVQRDKTMKKLIVFMDLDMPIMDGIEATVQLRKQSHGIRPYIVALTAYSSEMERSKCFEVGMDYFVSKPLTNAALYDVMLKLKAI